MHHPFLLCLLPLLATARADELPRYRDHADLSYYLDDRGARRAIKTPADWAHRVRHIHAAMQSVMGKLPPPADIPLDIRITSDTPLRHYTRRHLSFAVEKGDRAPAYLLIPHGPDGKPPRIGMLPGILCLPGSSLPGKDVPAGLTPDLHRAYAHELACRGHVCLVMDYPLRHTREYATDPYAMGYTSATMKGIVNHRRGVDLLSSLPFVDRHAIGVIGHSLGGHNALFLACFDPRVKVVVSSCGFNTFAKYYGGKLAGWSSKYYMPRIRTAHGDDPKQMPFDFTEILAALAPRPVFVNAPLHDSNFEVSGVRDCFRAARPIYRDVFANDDRLVVHYPDAGHTFPLAQRLAAYDFLERHLTKQSTEVDLKKGLVGDWPTVRTPLDVPADRLPRLGTGDFSIALRVQFPGRLEELAELVSWYDPVRRRGLHLTLKTNTGVTFSQTAVRQLQFAIDDQRASPWVDCGRPGKALLAFALAAHDGHLYAGTCEAGKTDAGRVHRYAGGQTWIDCGAPGRCNAVTALASFEGKLHAGTGKYRLAGSALPESENPHLGGRIYRHEGGMRWVDCGALPGAEAVGGLVVFRGRLYASSLYKPAGFFRYEGGTKWTDVGTPGGKRVAALGVFQDALYATGYDEGNVYRFNGEKWFNLGRLGKNTQTYALAAYQGKLHVSTWPEGRVYRLDGKDWTDTGRLGEELEVMGMMVHNGRLLAGTLPHAEVHSLEADGRWRRLATLDTTPDVRYRRAWTMAEHDGQLFCSTLPSGKVHAFAAGRMASWDHELPTGGERRLVAVRRAGRLELYVDGQLVARSTPFPPADFSLDVAGPLRLGSGSTMPLRGTLRSVRLYQRALSVAEVRALSTPERPGDRP